MRKKTKAYNERQARKRGRSNLPPAPPGTYLSNPVIQGEYQYHGSYASTSIATPADARALMKAARHNDNALRYLNYVNTQLQLSGNNRTEGQHELVTAWASFIVFEGARRDRARLAVGLPPRKDKKKHVEDSDRMETDETPAAPRSAAAHTAWLASLLPHQRGFANTPASQWPAGL